MISTRRVTSTRRVMIHTIGGITPGVLKHRRSVASDPAVVTRYGTLMDVQCVKLCDALNAIPGIQTTESCCGHGGDPFMVFFNCSDLRWLYIIGRATDRNYGGYGFRCEISTTDMPDHAVGFLLISDTNDLRGPPLKGRKAYHAANALADRINWLMSDDAAYIRHHFNLYRPEGG